ncbi:head-tail connector protein [Methylobacterium oryzisoli]|uniref:head-tail connector protein n=1 Tax=Methylobacterium oryzisoli TaxID=3385502 RepID=UPI003979B4D1
MSNITLEEVKAHLRITGNDDNALLQSKLEAAEAHVADFIGQSIVIDGKVPAPVREAVLQATAWFFDGTSPDLGGLLAPYRQWAF